MMAVCMFWLLTYVGQGLDLAVGNRPVIIMQEHQDYRHGSGIRKKSELGNNMLLKIYPSETSHRDEFSNWLLLNEEPRISSWTPAGILIDDMIREPRELQTVFFALSPATLNMLYSEYANTGSQEQFLQDDQQAVGGPLRGKKLRVDCRHPRNTVSLPIRVCDDDAGRKSLETRQSNYETNFKTDPSSRGPEKQQRDYQNGAAFVSRPPFGLDAAKPPGKRSYIPVGRRGVDLPGDANPQHQAQQPPPPPPPPSSLGNGVTVTSLPRVLRSSRGALQYDVPQIECPISDDGMERFACPVADRLGRYHCIDDHALCDGFIDCPSGEDEDRRACMFYKTTKAHLDVLADAILRWARGR